MKRKVHYILRVLLFFFVALLGACKESSSDFLTAEEELWLKEHPGLTVAIYPEYPPYQFIDDNNEVKGIFIDYFSLIEEKIGYEFQRVYYPAWYTVLEDAKEDKVDVIIEIQETESRKDYLNFTKPIFVQPYAILANKKFPKGSTIDDFKRDRIVTVDKYSVNEYLIKEHPEYYFSTVINDKSGVNAVLEGKADAFISMPSTISYFLKKKGKDNAHIVGEIPYKCTLGFATRDELTVLNTIFEKTISTIEHKEQKAIIDNWMLSIVVPFYMKPTFWYSLVGALLLFSAFILCINAALNQKVKKKTMKLSLAKDRAEECDRIKTVFWRNIAHEVRTPMNGIVGFSNMLKADLPLEDREQYVDIIQKSTTQLTRVIDDIVEVSRLHGHRITVKAEKTNIEELIADLIDIFQENATAKKLDLSFQSHPEYKEKYILIDKVKLHKILSHILENAIKFTEFGSVKVGYSISDSILEISVSDTGIGIATYDQKFIFDPFSKVDKTMSGQHGGLGLGLAIAKENVQLMRGDLTVDSAIGRGAVFKVQLPFEGFTKQEKITKTNIPQHKEVNTTSHNYKILIAEDSMVNYLYLRKVIEKAIDYKFSIVHAENGALAIDACKEQKDFDMIFMDIKMPVMDGYDATRNIKKLFPEIPIVVQTAYSSSEDINNAYNAGCDDFLSKPIDRDKMVLMLDKYLKKSSVIS